MCQQKDGESKIKLLMKTSAPHPSFFFGDLHDLLQFYSRFLHNNLFDRQGIIYCANKQNYVQSHANGNSLVRWRVCCWCCCLWFLIVEKCLWPQQKILFDRSFWHYVERSSDTRKFLMKICWPSPKKDFKSIKENHEKAAGLEWSEYYLGWKAPGNYFLLYLQLYLGRMKDDVGGIMMPFMISGRVRHELWLDLRWVCMRVDLNLRMFESQNWSRMYDG